MWEKVFVWIAIYFDFVPNYDPERDIFSDNPDRDIFIHKYSNLYLKKTPLSLRKVGVTLFNGYDNPVSFTNPTELVSTLNEFPRFIRIR